MKIFSNSFVIIVRVAGDQIFVVHKGYWWKIFEKIVMLLLLLISKSRYRSCSVKKGALNNLANFTEKKLVLQSPFNKVTGLRANNFLKEGVFPVKFAKLLRKKYLWTNASVFSQVILFTIDEKDTANEAYLEPS